MRPIIVQAVDENSQRVIVLIEKQIEEDGTLEEENGIITFNLLSSPLQCLAQESADDEKESTGRRRGWLENIIKGERERDEGTESENVD